MQKELNEFVTRLSTKITPADLKIVSVQLEMFFADYNIVRRETQLMSYNEDIFKEVKEYLVTRKIEGLSDKSLTRYKDALMRFFYNVNKPCYDITTNDVKKYLYDLKNHTGMKDISLNNQRCAISAFFSWLVDNDYIIKNPCATIKNIKCEKHTRHGLPAIDMETLRAACANEREKAIIEFLYATGCRCEEMSKVKLSDIDFSRKEVLLFGKGKKERLSYLNARSIVALQRYLENRKGNSPFLFCANQKPYNNLSVRSFESILQKIGERAGVDVTPHIIRHTTATDAINKGMPIEQVQILLGHESISTTLIYAETDQKNVKYGHEKYIV